MLEESGSKVNNKNDDVNIIIRLEEAYNSEHLFNIILYLENRGRIRIEDISSLDYNAFSKKGVYSFKSIRYSKEQYKLLKYIKELKFKVLDKDLRNFLFYCRNFDMQLKYNSFEYKGKICLEDLPLRFTLKIDGNKVRLQGTKERIVSLCSEGTVFLYDRKIYLPSFKQCKLYNPIYKLIQERHFAYVKESSLEKVVKIVSNIGKLTINDEVKSLLADRVKLVLYFYKKDKNIWCKFDDNSDFLRSSSKVKEIEEILFSNRFTLKSDKYLFLGEDEDLLELLKSEITNYCSIKKDNDMGDFNIISVDMINVSIREDRNNILFNINIDNIDGIELNNMLNSFASGDRFYRFNNYSFIDFKDEKISDLLNRIKMINYSGNEIILPGGYEELFLDEKSDVKAIDILREANSLTNNELKQPKGLKAKLRDYQLEGLRWMQEQKAKGLFGILADEMGLGKTIQAISYILLNKNEKSMIITQTSLVYNWQEEFLKFAPSIKVACVHGTKKKREAILSNIDKYDVILTSYGTLNMDMDYYKDIVFDNLIIDEGQNIKNPKSKISKNVKSIESRVKFALTGTPIENNLLEIWSIFDFLRSGYLFNEQEFKRKFNRADEKTLYYLKLLIKPFILRRTKKEVLNDLPEKIENTYYVSMTEEQKKYYKLSLKKISQEAKDISNQISILALLTKLRQIALDPSIIDNEYDGGSGKINATIDIVKKVMSVNKKMLIFSQFTSLLDKLRKELDDLDFNYYYLDGATKASDRVRLCREFNEGNDVDIFLISLKAGGTGLNLTSAEVVIHFDPWWNPAVENQATDRAHRIGQKNKVEVIKIISKGTIEEKIIKLKGEKEYLISSILEEDSLGKFNNRKLTKEELDYLLEYNE